MSTSPLLKESKLTISFQSGLFWVSPGIGADDFYAQPKTGRVCRVSRNSTQALTTLSSGLPPLFDNQNVVDFVVTPYNTGPESQEAADKAAASKGASSAK
jgi:hypothetical protein